MTLSNYSMNNLIGKSVLLTTSEWFYAPDGQNYKAVWGRLIGIHEAGKTLGFIPNRAHANWFIEVGKMIVMGCQVRYIVQCDEKPNTGRMRSWTSDAANGVKEFDTPSVIYISE